MPNQVKTCPGQEWESRSCEPAGCPTPGACSSSKGIEELRAKLADAEDRAEKAETRLAAVIHEQTAAALARLKADGIKPTMTVDEVLELTRGGAALARDIAPMSEIGKRACKNCDGWEDMNLPGQDVGECRGGLPALSYIAPAGADASRSIFLNAGVWPWTSSDKWCWAFRPRGQSQEQPND